MEPLIKKITNDYPSLHFVDGKKYAFRPSSTIVIGPKEPFAELLLLHEVGHAICKHREFKMDVERLKMEVEAWEKARELAPIYNVEINDEMIQLQLDTYRDWLHQKSRCPKCGLTRFQTPNGLYHCPLCENH